MASVAQLVMLTIMYYILVGIMVFSLSMGGMFENSNMVQGSFNSGTEIEDLFNVSSQADYPTTLTYITHTAAAFIDVFKFFRFLGLDLGLGGFGNFLVTLVFGWMPGLVSILLIMFAVRGGSS